MAMQTHYSVLAKKVGIDDWLIDCCRWHLALCFLVTWHIVAAVVVKGIRASPEFTIFR
jgi:hypothetical protein